MSPARTRRTVATIVAVWLVGLLLVLGLWQRVDAACGPDGAGFEAATDCNTVRGVDQAAGAVTPTD
ncbi:MAG: hypothetical protein WD010_09790 [Nitriliruptor sp.]